jgi:hypothetical protein
MAREISEQRPGRTKAVHPNSKDRQASAVVVLFSLADSGPVAASAILNHTAAIAGLDVDPQYGGDVRCVVKRAMQRWS